MLLSRFFPSSHRPHFSRMLYSNRRLRGSSREYSLSVQHVTIGECGQGECRDGVQFVEKLINQQQWLMPEPSTPISRIVVKDFPPNVGGKSLTGVPSMNSSQDSMQFVNAGFLEANQSDSGPGFYVIRDDLLHPLLGGNKVRKLDGLIPELQKRGATDVVTCGGCQSAHTAALAFACAERGINAHLLLRGERPAIPTGYNLLCGMYGHVTYIPRSEYANRAGMLTKHALKLAGNLGSVSWLDEFEANPNPGSILTESEELERSGEGGWRKNVIVVKEGAGDAIALLGVIRLVRYLSQPTRFGAEEPLHMVVDTGTGTTAVGVALGVALLGLPWKVTGVILADSIESYENHRRRLVTDFATMFSFSSARDLQLPLVWEQRSRPRKFGKVLPGEIGICRSIARHTGILLDPVYTLAGWETAVRCFIEVEGVGKIVMLHTGASIPAKSGDEDT
ncbi:hypothetical protein R1sor_014714 [Riccia sorocarpa]|uniref:Tryptophan synthase beta chain-like PALP domain-containing protein n=1 Tax=Riccia sorocarpa TaxID=122646 RepID=A0ABD3HDC3_9MARC